MRSAGQHGSSLDVRAALAPLFRTYGVQLAVAGHGPIQSPSSRPRSAGRSRVAPSARGSRSNAMNTPTSNVARNP